MSEKHIGRIIKASRIMAGNGLRRFAEAIGLQPSRMSDIEVGAAATDAELDAIATEIERTWQDGIAWRERIVAERDALTARLAAAEARAKGVEEALGDVAYAVVVARNRFSELNGQVTEEVWNGNYPAVTRLQRAMDVLDKAALLSAGVEAKDGK